MPEITITEEWSEARVRAWAKMSPSEWSGKELKWIEACRKWVAETTPVTGNRMTTKTIPLTELRDTGYLQEANRQFFHPLGLALTVDLDTDTLYVQDWRDIDNEGGFFAEHELVDAEQKAANIAHELQLRAPQRVAYCGHIIQPIPGHGKTGVRQQPDYSNRHSLKYF